MIPSYGWNKMNSEEITVEASEKKMHTLARRAHITPAGEAWLTAVLDPCHDNPIENLIGMPDMESAPSVVRVIKESVQISQPFGITYTGNWDLHVFNQPFQTQLLFDRVTRTNTHQTASVTPNLLIGGIQYNTAKAGQPWSYDGVAGTTSNSIFLDPIYTIGSSRIIGMGMEIVNTTAPLYDQGLLTVYRQKNCLGEAALYTRPTLGQDFMGTPVRGAPADIAAAMLLPGTKQWRAGQGAYMTITVDVEESRPRTVAYCMPVLHFDNQDDREGGNVSPNTSDVYFPTSLGGVNSYYSAVRNHPIDISGCFLTGLANSATVTVNVIWYLEAFPSRAEADIVVLAHPSAPQDQIALELYSEASGKLPAGVPFSENPGGEWFSEVVDLLVDAAPTVVAALGGPALGAAAGMAAGAVKQFRKKKPPPPPAKQAQEEMAPAPRVVGVPVPRQRPRKKPQPKVRKPVKR